MALNIADLAEHAIDAVPDRVALISGDEQLTYAGLEGVANRLVTVLLHHGARPGTKVVWCGRNSIGAVTSRPDRSGIRR